jgi:dTDP-4-dehydrorhamnose 3,5-epimerase-like enzyme
LSGGAFDLTTMSDRDDGRGAAFFVEPDTLAWLGPVADLHVVAIGPGKVRGNHKHAQRREVIVLHYHGGVEIAWREPQALRTQHLRFDGQGGLLIRIEPGTLHAFRNIGDGFVEIVSLSNGRFDRTETTYETLLEELPR